MSLNGGDTGDDFRRLSYMRAIAPKLVYGQVLKKKKKKGRKLNTRYLSHASINSMSRNLGTIFLPSAPKMYHNVEKNTILMTKLEL